MNTMTIVITVILGGQSILAAGFLIDAVIAYCSKRKALQQQLQAVLDDLGRLTRRYRAARKSRHRRDVYRDVRKIISDEDCPPALWNVISQIAASGGDTMLVNQHAGGWIQQLDGGARRVNGFLAKTAPLVGLAGTLVGISQSLQAFANDASEPESIIRGFSVAIGTTLFGVIIAVIALVTSRLLWQPFLNQSAASMLKVTTLLRRLANEGRRSAASTSSEHRGSDSSRSTDRARSRRRASMNGTIRARRPRRVPK